MRITCPNCGFSRDVPENKIPSNAQIATCPKCSHRFKFRDIKKEDFILEENSFGIEEFGEEMDDLSESKGYKQFTEGDREDAVPWEQIEKYGFWNALFLTIKKVMFNPIDFFRNLPINGKILKALIFYLIISEIQAVSQLLWGIIGVLKIEDPVKVLLGFSLSGTASVFILIFYPLFLTVILFVGSFINHLCLRILGSGRGGFEATFKVVSYSIAPLWLSIIPILGTLIGSVWSLVLSLVGFTYVHNTSIGRVILAIFLPLIVLIILVIIKSSL